MKRLYLLILSSIFIVLISTSCNKLLEEISSELDSDTSANQTAYIQGVISTGQVVTGDVTLKDAEGTTIGPQAISKESGYAFTITDLKGPFLIKAGNDLYTIAHHPKDSTYFASVTVAHINPVTTTVAKKLLNATDLSATFETVQSNETLATLLAAITAVQHETAGNEVVEKTIGGGAKYEKFSRDLDYVGSSQENDAPPAVANILLDAAQKLAADNSQTIIQEFDSRMNEASTTAIKKRGLKTAAIQLRKYMAEDERIQVDLAYGINVKNAAGADSLFTADNILGSIANVGDGLSTFKKVAAAQLDANKTTKVQSSYYTLLRSSAKEAIVKERAINLVNIQKNTDFVASVFIEGAKNSQDDQSFEAANTVFIDKASQSIVETDDPDTLQAIKLLGRQVFKDFNDYAKTNQLEDPAKLAELMQTAKSEFETKIQKQKAIGDGVSPTSNAVQGAWTNGMLIATLTAEDDKSGIKDIYYQITYPDIATITTKNVSTDGQPTIISEQSEYTLIYWAVDIAQNIEKANTLAITKDTVAPGPVTQLVATPNDASVSLTWKAPVDQDLSHILICRSTLGIISVPTDENSTTFSGTLPHVDTGLTNGVEYTYTIFAVDKLGNISEAASIATTPKDDVKPTVSSFTHKGGQFVHFGPNRPATFNIIAQNTDSIIVHIGDIANVTLTQSNDTTFVGTFNIDAADNINQENITITATLTDANNVSITATADVALTIDSSSPAAPEDDVSEAFESDRIEYYWTVNSENFANLSNFGYHFYVYDNNNAYTLLNDTILAPNENDLLSHHFQLEVRHSDTTPHTLSSGTTYNYRLTVVDKALNESSPKEFQVLYDMDPPVTTYSGFDPDTWYNTDITVLFSAQDVGGAGIRSIEYAINNDWKTVQANGNPVISEEGKTEISYLAIDNLSNLETVRIIQWVRIDKSAPTSNVSYNPLNPNSVDGLLYFKTGVNFWVGCNDGMKSGVKELHYTINGGDEVVETDDPGQSFNQTSNEGLNNIAHYAIDNLDHESTPATFSFVIDFTSPDAATNLSLATLAAEDEALSTSNIPADTDLKLTWTASTSEDIWCYQIQLGSEINVTVNSSTTSYTLPDANVINSGSTTIHVYTQDKALNATDASLLFTVE